MAASGSCSQFGKLQAFCKLVSALFLYVLVVALLINIKKTVFGNIMLQL